MTDPFDSPAALLSRARRHIKDMETDVSAFFREHASAPLAHHQSPGVNVSYIVRLDRDVPLAFGAAVFDVVNNLRAALDHAVYAAAIRITKLPEPEGTKFPFGDNPEDVRKDFFRNRPPAGLESLADLCVSLGAHKGGGNEALWRLNKLRNGKIHRLLSPVGVQIGKFAIEKGNFFASGITLPNAWDSEKNELTILRADRLQGDVEMQFAFDVSFIEGAWAGGSAAKTMSALAHLAEDVVARIRERAESSP